MADKTRLFLALALASALLLIPLPVGSTRWAQVLHDAAHAPLFAVLTLLALRTMPGKRRPHLGWPQVLTASVAMILFALASEVMQSITGRDASAIDLIHDLLGIGFGIAVYARPRAPRSWGTAIAVMLLAAIAPLAWTAAAYAQRQWQRPVLWQQRTPLDGYFLEFNGAVARAVAASDCIRGRIGRALWMDLQSGQYPSVALTEPFADWRSYQFLMVDLVNVGPQTSPLGLRIHDATHNFRYEDRYTLHFRAPSHRLLSLRIPLADVQDAPSERSMDLSQVAGLMLFGEGVTSTSLCLFSVQLR